MIFALAMPMQRKWAVAFLCPFSAQKITRTFMAKIATFVRKYEKKYRIISFSTSVGRFFLLRFTILTILKRREWKILFP